MDLRVVQHSTANDIDSSNKVHYILWGFDGADRIFGYTMRFKFGDMETFIESLLGLAEKIEAEIKTTK
jgi:hypothetical protein